MEGLEALVCDSPSTDSNNNSNGMSSPAEEKYALRPRTIIKRLQQERKTRQEVVPKRPEKTKSRPAPLSKYRRKTANARERHRMRQINNAFESLRKVLPDAVEVHATSTTITKIMTLRLAVDYIRALSGVLEDDGDPDFSSFENSLHTSIHNSLQTCLQHSLPPCHQPHPLERAMSPSTMILQQQEHSVAPFSQPYATQLPHLLGHYTVSSAPMSASSSPSTARRSLSSASDLEELLSDDSALLEDNLNVFHDIQSLAGADAFDILLGAEKDNLTLTTEMCN